MIIEILVFVLTALFVYFYYLHTNSVKSLTTKGVKVVPGIPFFGNFLKSSFLRRHIIEDIDDCYRYFPEERYIGVMESTTPIIIIRDPELIRLITVKDFDHFVDHRQFFNDDLFSNSLLWMKGEKWRQMRATLSPAFTASKMKQMLPFMNSISENIVEYLRRQMNEENVTEEIDMDDLMRRYANDVIASTAFGIEVNSVVDKTNEFYETGQKLSNFSTWVRIKMMIVQIFPDLAKKLNIQAFPEKTTAFFRSIVTNTMEYREKNNVERPDMIQLLMQAAKEWTLEELVGQVFIFFFAGFETSASVLVMTVHELALDSEIQTKVYEEITQFRDDSLTYDTLQNMKYLEMVINETLRKWSPALIMDRVCLKPYDLPPSRPGAKPYTVEPGQVVYNMVNSIHMDEKYYPEPHCFDPERFSEENKNNIKPFTFMPFGMGPRYCIGARFALLEVKILLYHLVLNFEILKCEKTSDPIHLKPTDFPIKALGGTWVKLRKRN